MKVFYYCMKNCCPFRLETGKCNTNTYERDKSEAENYQNWLTENCHKW